MKAEERWGRGGYHCALFTFVMFTSTLTEAVSDIGNGTYEPIYGQTGVSPAQAPVNYGSTGANYVR